MGCGSSRSEAAGGNMDRALRNGERPLPILAVSRAWIASPRSRGGTVDFHPSLAATCAA